MDSEGEEIFAVPVFFYFYKTYILVFRKAFRRDARTAIPRRTAGSAEMTEHDQRLPCNPDGLSFHIQCVGKHQLSGECKRNKLIRGKWFVRSAVMN